MTTRLAIAEDTYLVREALEHLFATVPEIEVVATLEAVPGARPAER